MSVGGQIGEWLSGTYAAIGTLVSRTRALADGPGELVDLSMLEVMAMCLTYYPVTYADMVGRPFRTGRSNVTPGVESTSDGLVGLGVGTGQQWLDFCTMVGHDEWTDDRKLFADRSHLRPEIAAWMAEHTTAEVLDLAGAFRIPHAPIGNGASIPATDHFQARGSIVANPRDGFAEPARPYRFDPPLLATPTPAPHLGEHTPSNLRRGDDAGVPPASREPIGVGSLPFAGLRVLDLTAFWAGPLCTHVLAMLGADVLHLESTTRPDGTRMLAGLRFSEPDWWEQSGIFSGLNAGKRSVTLDLATDEGKELVAPTRRDLRRPRREQHAPGARADRTRPRHGARAPARPGGGADARLRPRRAVARRPAFAFVIEDAAGITWRTGFPDTNPVSPYCVGDSNAGLHALTGLLLALEHRRRTGEGVVVEAPMVDAALNVAAEQIVEHAAYGAVLARHGNRGPAAAPQGLYRTADVDDAGGRDDWVAIAVATDDQWAALREALGGPDWAMDPELDTVDGRRARHDEIDAELSAWCDARTGDEVVDALWEAGVPVGKVVLPHQQGELPQLQHRGFFELVDHPIAGTARHSTLPMRFSRGPERIHRRHAPLLGEHTTEVLGALGLSDEELADLAERGVTGRAPASRG